MGTTIPITDVRRTLGSVLAGLKEPTFITQRGEVKAVLLSIDAYNAMLAATPQAHATVAMAGVPQHEPPKDHLRAEKG